MSTTFDVFPKTEFIPTYEELFKRASINLQSYLTGIGAQLELELTYKQLKISDNEIVNSITSKSPYLTNHEHYVWIQFVGIEGGIDAYFDFTDKDILEELVEGNHLKESMIEEIKMSSIQGYYWSFRRSAGQPELINLFYGIIASTLAEITDGIVFSGDSAWEYEALPVKGKEFLAIYMNPEQILNDVEFKDLAKECISSLKKIKGSYK